MSKAQATRLVGHIDCPGGGQVWVDGSILYVGHMRHPSGTSVYDVSDPARPRLLSRIELPEGWHSHKVRVKDGVMVVNHERLGQANAEFGGGLAIYDVANPAEPKPITKWMTAGKGVHRYDFDGRYAYISPTVEGYVGNIAMILDLADPARPEEVGRWWIPGQWEAGGEAYPWHDWVPPRCHHPLRVGNRLYVSYWHHGFFILDIEDMARPRAIAARNTSGSFPHPTHTCLKMPMPLKGRDIMLVADEDVAKLYPSAPAFTWVYDITNELDPISIATFQVPGLDADGSPQPAMTGCHQPSEVLSGTTVVPFAWFAQGLRLVDFADPFAPREVGCYEPDPPAGFERSSSNDVTLDARGLIYLIDRQNGVDIIETTAF
ncbi:MAG: hypothetical protein R3F55_03785 [Alphaproteobacteria bacterium]